MTTLIRLPFASFLAALALTGSAVPPSAHAQTTAEAGETEATSPTSDEKKVVIEAAAGRLRLLVPSRWKRVEATNRLIEVEFSVTPAEATDGRPGRLTMMAAGGSVEANLQRWKGQFRLGQDADGKDRMREESFDVAGAKVHLLDIAGTFFERTRGPFGPAEERPDYRMLGAILELEGAGKYFVKLYGPADLIADQQQAFRHMLDEVRVVTEAAP